MYTVIARIEQAAVNAGRDPNVPRLCAVSKTKPAIAVQELYEAGHRIFGENYVQELVEKSAQLPADISWHFIGSLQSNKVKPLLRDVPSLACVQTVDSAKLALKLNSAVEALARAPLDVYLQVDTSGEDTKSGIPPAELGELVQFVSANCPQLRLKGLMTIGAPGDLTCFDRLVECRAEAASLLGIEPDVLELSMGMSGDFEEAVARGATCIRVGSTIFGERDYSAKEK